MSHKRRICFVTGTRAEFGLMLRTLDAIRHHPQLQLQIIATGMHLSKSRGSSIQDIRKQGFNVNRTVAWNTRDVSPVATARSMGRAIADLAQAFADLQSDIVLVVGDRVEAFAAASAASISGRIVAHVHGGDRALGQVDDALRHAITKLSHVHFPATKKSAARILKLGEDSWRIHQVGSPGIDGIRDDADPTASHSLGLKRRMFALIALHPTDADDSAEFQRANTLLWMIKRAGVSASVIIYPNTDPGSEGIRRCWEDHQADPQITLCPNLVRSRFLGLLRDCAFVVGNSSSGIIEAASFGTPVVDIGPRQQGRERGGNVIHVEDAPEHILRAIRRVWRSGSPRTHREANIYGSGAAKKIAHVLASLQLDTILKRKLISY